MTIGVAVPCYGPHIAKLPSLLQSIEAQSRRPDQVVVCCSGAEPADVADVPRAWSFPLDIIVVAGRQNAAQNRNTAARRLDTDVVSYIDADDIMHPQRLEVVGDTFATTGVDMVLHGCLSPPDPDYDAAFRTCPTPWPVTVNQPGAKQPAASAFTPMHSQVSVTRVLAQSGQPEQLSLERREDIEFVDAVIATHGVRSAFVDLPLSKYDAAGSWEGAPPGSGAYQLNAAASRARRLMHLPLLRHFKAPVQALWRSLPLSFRQRWLK